MNFSVTESQKKRFNMCMTEYDSQQQGLEKLAQKMLALDKPVLCSQKKDDLRESILRQISLVKKYETEVEFAGLIGYIRKIVSFFKLDIQKRANMKERIFAAIEAVPQKNFFFQNLFALHKRLVSGVLVVLLFFGMFSFVNLDTSIVMASTFTTVESFIGDVGVTRGGDLVPVHRGMELFEGDKISTGSDGMVVVKYFDDSITRFAPETNVVINKLFKFENNVESYVEIFLEQGVVWSKVFNLVGDDSAFVLKARDVSAVAKKAAFNAEFKNQKLEVKVFNRTVDVHKNDKIEKVTKGHKAVVNGDVEIVSLPESEKNSVWIKDNLESDKEYLAAVEDRLLDAKVKSMDVSIGTSLREDIAVFLTFNDVDKQKKELDLAEKDLIAAEVKLSDPNLSSEEKSRAEAALAAFSDKAKEFNELVKEVGYSDEKYSAELREYLDNKVLMHQKDLSVIMPNSPLYEVKKVVDDVALVGIEDDTELVEKKLDQVAENLSVAEDATILGQPEVARAVVDDSKEELNSVVQMIDTLEEESPGVVTTLVPKVDEVQQYLTVVSTDSAESPTNVSTSVEPVATDISTEIVTDVVQSVPEIPSITVPVPVSEPVSVPVSEDTSIQKTEYGIYVKDDKPLPAGFNR